MTQARRDRVLITGATSGIGLALAKRLAAGADLLLTGRRAAAEVSPVLPAGAAYAQADQSRPADAARAVAAAIERLGWTGIDRAFLNAGTGFAVDPAAETTDAIRATLDANLVATVALAHTLHAPLSAAGGSLTLIGSLARRGAPGFATYAASKGALDGFARALREEWRGVVDVRIVHPGPAATDMHAKAGYDPGRLRRLFLDPASAAELVDILSRRRRSPAVASHGALLLRRIGLLR